MQDDQIVDVLGPVLFEIDGGYAMDFGRDKIVAAVQALVGIAYAAGMERAAVICDQAAKTAHSHAAWESHSRLRACADAIRAEIKEKG